jgi:hypothetical protein
MEPVKFFADMDTMRKRLTMPSGRCSAATRDAFKPWKTGTVLVTLAFIAFQAAPGFGQAANGPEPAATAPEPAVTSSPATALTPAAPVTTAPKADLTIGANDLRIEQLADGGFHLYVRKKAGVGSVLLTESTKDPARKADNYAYRSPEYNPINGDEKRLLNGAFIPPEKKLYSLISSTPVSDAQFGEAFHIFIPYVIEYGYAWSRNGVVQVVNGTFLGIRTFEKPYADYAGAFADNPFAVKVVQKPIEGPMSGNYSKDTVETFKEIAKAGAGEVHYATGPTDIASKIDAILEDGNGKTVDLVLCVDTTASMQDDIASVRKMVPPLLKKRVAGFKNFRIGMVLYKDYYEEYMTKDISFVSDLGKVQTVMDSIRVAGGGDIPEAVYEALYAAVKDFPWQSEKRIIVLIGDAPPHPLPRGKITKEIVYAAATDANIELDVIILPN